MKQGADGSTQANHGQQLAEWAAGDFTELLRGLIMTYGRDLKEPEVILVPQVGGGQGETASQMISITPCTTPVHCTDN
jgi:hypothetical protein